MIVKLYSDFDAPVIVRASEQKTMYVNDNLFKKLRNTPDVTYIAPLIEETVVVRHENNWVNAQIIGADSSFLRIAKIEKHMVDGFPALMDNGETVGIIGASLLDKLGGFISPVMEGENILVYAPKRNLKSTQLINPFNAEILRLVGRMNYNREVNTGYLIAPIDFVRKLSEYESKEYTHIAVGIEEKANKYKVKEAIQKTLGTAFDVKTNDEKNALIFKTSKTERLIVLNILLFIFILASFNLVASLTMLFFEKQNELTVLSSMGMSRKGIFNIFFLEGCLVAGKGIVFGLFLGYVICFLQINFSFIQMPNSYGEAFPIAIFWKDGILILVLVSLLSLITSYLTVKLLMKRNFISQ